MAGSLETDAARSAPGKFVPTYVISLADAAVRRRNMAARLAAAGIPFRFFDAVDGRTHRLPDTIDGARIVRAPFSSEAGVACAASHRLLHRAIAEGDADAVLILEDDASIADDFADVVEKALAFEFDVLKLEGINASKRRIAVGSVGRYDMIVTNRPSVGSAAYLLRREAAQRICRLPALDQASDYVFQDTRLRLRVLETYPFCAWQDPTTDTQLAHSPNRTYVPENKWSPRRMVESVRRKAAIASIYGPRTFARLELQRIERWLKK